ncbi:MAG: MBL fold metallo-hydrolase [Methanocalculaceae archaeon]|jgi:phosphoribosyl 1,2-cyclic phosphate phosphodiesterase|nr:MBL fold metallo-hydrolase [Methanocalculaceae archaeon]
MRITALGTGDVVGTPKIGCDCPICCEARQTGKQRLRTSILVEYAGKYLLIDTSPDLRAQLLAAGSPHIDAVIWTHGHYDHFMGFGDFYRVQREFIHVYGAPEVLSYCGGIFSFMRHREIPLMPHEQTDICGMQVTIFPVVHDTPTYGVRIEVGGVVFVYSSDTAEELPKKTLEIMKNADLLLLDGIFPPGINISKHMNIREAERLAERLSPKTFWCVHMSHKIWWSYEHGARDMQTWNLAGNYIDRTPG